MGLLPPGPGPLLRPQSCSRTSGLGPAQSPGIPGEKDTRAITTLAELSLAVKHFAMLRVVCNLIDPVLQTGKWRLRGTWTCSSLSGWTHARHSLSGPNGTRNVTPGARDSPGKGLEAGIRGPCPRTGKHWDFLRAASWSQPGLTPPHLTSPSSVPSSSVVRGSRSCSWSLG